jgi:HK97 family phage major capsid protein
MKTLREKRATLVNQAREILDRAEAEKRDLTAEERQQYDGIMGEVDSLGETIKRGESLAETERALNQSQGRRVREDDTPPATRTDAELRSAFGRYLREGRQGLSADEVRALAANEDAAGGYLVYDQYRNELLTKQRDVSAMRRLARVLPPIAGGSVITPTVDTDFADADWTVELGTGNEDTTKPFGRRSLTPHPFAKRVKISNTLLRSPGFDAEGFTRDELAYKFGVTEEKAFVNGDGQGKPQGLFSWASLSSVVTAAQKAVAADDLINWVYSLKSGYQANARILTNINLIRKVRLLKGTDNNYLWQPGLAAGNPDTLLGKPVEVSDQVDDGLDANDAWEANKIIAVIGDFRYYWIVDSLQLSIQRLVELYAEANQTGLIGRKETDGMPVLDEAFKGLKIKA